MTDAFRNAYLSALAPMEQSGRPQRLHDLAEFLGRNDQVTANDEALQTYLSTSTPDDPLRMKLHLNLATWDNIEDADWTASTEHNTDERRAVITTALAVDDATAKVFLDQFPINKADDIVIANTWSAWYTTALRQKHDFYWNAYKKVLTGKKWSPAAIAALDVATTEVVERLSDPTRIDAYQAKGIVVGYVQSGKTANFTGVVAKAVDAGYRLVIVLTGTTDLLRSQTQRRLDMELIGVENIKRGVADDDQEGLAQLDYQDDHDWLGGKFLSHGVWPADVDRPAIHRLTTYAGDYKSLRNGIEALNFPKHGDRKRPFYHPVNLYSSDAKVAIVKKNATVLSKLVRDLRTITAKLGEIPVLIIDDESDQASVNTSNPKRWLADRKDRTSINRLISELLKLLPRAQYIGYTATPFANVFIDPDDSEDIFPKDFLISLRRPPGYMGASDFHDLDCPIDIDDRTFSNSRELAHVRRIQHLHGADDTDLLKAIDTFVLTGAMKLYRADRGIGEFRHHTMLAHEAMNTVKHKEQADRIRALWSVGGYYSPTASPRLRVLFDSDLLPVSHASNTDLPVPATFDELKPYIPAAVHKISRYGDPVIVVNSDKDALSENLDFDRENVWRIVVGGNKLSRGFTIEGLTVSYFLRRAKSVDTMMQMGRWFGFRTNYQDFVRLYISPELYEAFEGIVLDEEFFRAELRRFATPVDGRPQVTPREVPPLVAQHLPWLKPTSPNKMYNAALTERQSPGIGVEPTGYPKDITRLRENTNAFRPLLDAASNKIELRSSIRNYYPAFVGIIEHQELLRVLQKLSWLEDDYFEPDLRWLNRLGPDKIEDWAVILPQHARSAESTRLLLGHGPLSLFSRERRRDPYFGAIRDPKHLFAAKRIIGEPTPFDDPAADRLARPRRGALIVYPVIESTAPAANAIASGQVVMAFHLLAPLSATTSDGRLVTFTTRNTSRRNAAIVDAQD